jgi:hypothetical protein
MQIDSKIYAKNYYEEHKDKMKEQNKALLPDRMRRKIINALNNEGYKRLPFEKIKKYNIIYDETTKLYN